MEEHQKVLCGKCGSPDFEYDSYWKEYSCKDCGWIVEDDEKITALGQRSKPRVDHSKIGHHVKCSRCGVPLLTLTEVKYKYSQQPRVVVDTMHYLSQMVRDRDAIGVTCAVCGRSFCSACMKSYGKPHAQSGGLACLECAGHMTEFQVTKRLVPQEVQAIKIKNRVINKLHITTITDNWHEKSLSISPNLRKVAFSAYYGEQWYIDVNGKKSKNYEGLLMSVPIFSPDSEHIAYVAVTAMRDDAPRYVVKDTIEERHYDNIDRDTLKFSPDSQHLAYAALLKEKWFIVMDGKEHTHYDGIGVVGLIFSPNSQRSAYVGIKGNKHFLESDDKEDKNIHDEIFSQSVRFSPDSQRVAFHGILGHKSHIVVDNKKDENYYDGILNGSPIFSPDSNRVAYGALKGQKWCVVVDGKEHIFCNGLKSLTFSPDSQRIAYPAEIGKYWCVVIDYEEQDKFDDIDSIVFSPDSKRIAFRARKGNRSFVVLDGEEQKYYDSVSPPTFNSKSDSLAYFAFEGDKRFVVLNTKEHKRYDVVGSPTFSPDGGHVVYSAICMSDKKCFIVIDGSELQIDNGMFFKTLQVSFDSSNTFHYLIHVGNSVYLIEETIE